MRKKLPVLIFYVLFNSIQTSGKFSIDDGNFNDPLDIHFDNVGSIWDSEFVKVQLYYESLCQSSRNFHNGVFLKAVQTLSQNLDINVFPYGNARTQEVDGNVEITCQHGPAECYGNKLHACALDLLHNITQALLYNSCLMDSSRTGQGSDDTAADLCGQKMKINSDSIKACARGDRGFDLLKYYGDLSSQVHYNQVPYILINGQEYQEDSSFMEALCKAYQNPPKACQNII